MFRAFIVLCSLCAVTAFAGPKKATPKDKKPAPTPAPATIDPAKQEAVKATLSSIQRDVRSCVVDNEADRPGEWKQTVRIKVTLDVNGAVMENKVELEPQTADAADTRACVEALVKSLSWPAPGTPLTIVEREWTYAFK